MLSRVTLSTLPSLATTTRTFWGCGCLSMARGADGCQRIDRLVDLRPSTLGAC